MNTSLPSTKVSILDVPEVRSFTARFVYDFFTADESHNDSSVAPDSVKRLPAESFDAERIENIRRVVPRFVRFDFAPPVAAQGILHGNEFNQNQFFDDQRISIARNISRVQSEEDFSGRAYTGIEFQDDNLDTKLYTLASGSIAKRVTSKNRNIQQQIDENRKTVLDSLTDEHSLLDAARALADDTSDNVSNNVVINALNQIDALKLKFIDDTSTRVLIDQTFKRVKDVAVKGQLTNKLVGRIVKNIVNDPMSPFADEFSSLQTKAGARQIETLARLNPRIVESRELESPVFKALLKHPVDVHDAPASSRVVGYVIEKIELTADNKLKRHPPIIIENALQTTAVDLRVAYGHTYIYTIRTVAQLRVRASYEDIDEVVLATGLVQSRRSPRSSVTCVEDVPPPNIADFNILWSFQHDAPMLIWSFPTNPQRDIKRFQVFKRSSVNEPFQLIKELDFDDSDLRIDGGETPAPELVEKLSSPVTSFLDTEFTKDARAIYAICSIDAHGISSNYSIQMEASFDTFRNKLKKRLVSNAGAPKSYPNMALMQDTFVDTMKVSDHTRVNVVFDPEFLEVFDQGGNDLGLLVTDKTGADAKYRLQFINTDVQKQEVVDIRLRDRRTARTAKS